MRMTSKLLALSLSLLLILGVLAACANTPDDPASSDSEPQDSTVQTDPEDTKPQTPSGNNGGNSGTSGGNNNGGNNSGNNTGNNGDDTEAETTYPFDRDVSLPWVDLD